MYSDPLPPRSPSDPAPPPPRRVRPAHLAAIAAVGVAALGLMGLQFATRPEAAPAAAGDALKIELVAPVEPDLLPGSVMDVGELVDGFRYAPPRRAERAPVYDADWTGDEDAMARAPSARPAGVRRYTSPDAEGAPPPEPEPPRRERGRRWFGFDNPLPDFGAERRARQARLDELEDRRRADREDRADRRRYSSGPPPYEERRDDRRNYNPPRYEPPADEAGEGPYGPEVG